MLTSSSSSYSVEEELPVVVEGEVLEDGEGEGEEEKTFTRPRFVQVKLQISPEEFQNYF